MNKYGIAFELGKNELAREAPDEQLQQLGQHFLRMLQFCLRHIGGIAGDIGQQEIAALCLRLHTSPSLWSYNIPLAWERVYGLPVLPYNHRPVTIQQLIFDLDDTLY